MKKTNEAASDLTDPKKDREKLKGDRGTLDLPELKDIPGQKKKGLSAGVPPGDTTISSADEEGDDVLGNEDEDAFVSPQEEELPDQSFDPPYDADLPVEEISLDDRDSEGERLEESGPEQDLFGEDLDDDLTEEEDEESEGENEKGDGGKA
ncbi:MAG TPA: hypothetical protein VGM24_06285 [Puia sp.]|jgi:hypothetical protein